MFVESSEQKRAGVYKSIQINLKKMKRIIAFLACAATMCGCAMFPGNVSGPEMTEKFELSSEYSEVQISGAISVTYSDTAALVSVTSDSASLANFRFSVENGVLSMNRNASLVFGNGGTSGISVVLPVSESLSSVDVSGASRFVAEQPVVAENFMLDVSGASTFKAEVRANVLDAEVSGASSALISGTACKASLFVSGASKMSSDKCYVTADEVTVDVSGASKLVVGCDGSLSGDVSGASRAVCHGKADSHVKVTGASDFKRVE